MRKVEVTINPRVHIGLISMHAGAPRKNGGLGFAVEGPPASVKIEGAQDFIVADRRRKPMLNQEVERLRLRLAEVRRAHGLPEAAAIEISGDFLTHHGMGSGTAIQLACVEGLLALNQRQLGREELIRLSGRGGTSGVGISTYFDGGFVFDLGVRGGGLSEFIPSSIATDIALPLLLHQQSFPNWPLGLCLPRKCKPKTQDEEIEFFQRVTPLAPDKTFEAAYVAMFQILASIIDENYESFCHSIDAMQSCEWKRLERAEYAPELETADCALRRLGADCVGMSSLGPMLFFFAPPTDLKRILASASQLDADIFITSPANTGRNLVVN